MIENALVNEAIIITKLQVMVKESSGNVCEINIQQPVKLVKKSASCSCQVAIWLYQRGVATPWLRKGKLLSYRQSGYH